MKILQKIEADVLLQMLNSDSIVENFSNNLKKTVKKIAAPLLISSLMATATGMSMAGGIDDNRNIGLGVSAVAGVLSNTSTPNLHPDCNVQGASGWKIGGAGAAGATVGNMMFQKDQTANAVATGVAGIWAAAVAAGNEQRRMEAECSRQLREKGIAQPSNYRTPNAIQNPALPVEPILYETTVNGTTFYITGANSEGLAQIQGKSKKGEVSLTTNPEVKKMIDTAVSDLEIAYKKLGEVSDGYDQSVKMGESVNRSINTAITMEEKRTSEDLAMKHRDVLNNWSNAFSSYYTGYVQRRAYTVSMLDKAAARNFDVTEYSKVIDYVVPPQSAFNAYSNAKKTDLPNKYGVIR